MNHLRQLWIFCFFLISSWKNVFAQEPFYSMGCSESLNDVDYAKIYVNPPPQDIVATYGNTLNLYVVNEDCYKCSKTYLSTFLQGNQSCYAIWVPFEWSLYIGTEVDSSITVISKDTYTFGEYGQYNIDVSTNSQNTPVLTVDEFEKPINSYQALEIMIGLLLLAVIVSFGAPVLYKRYKTNFAGRPDSEQYFNALTTEKEDDLQEITFNDNGKRPETKKPKKSKRLVSLDTFRGFALTLMIFVNYGGGGYWFFEHAAWNGLTLADLVFPWFMWIMGVSMALSFSNILPKKPTRATTIVMHSEEDPDYQKELANYNKKYWEVWKKVSIRAFKLFALGMFLANGYEYITWRIPGVLQYFAVSYFVTAATILICYPYTQSLLDRIKLMEKTTSYGAELEIQYEDEIEKDIFNWERLKNSLNYSTWSAILTAYRYEWILQILILIIFLSIHLGAKAPGCPRGYLGPGGISEDSEYHFCTGGIHRYLDMKIFGYDLIYHHPTCLNLYSCRPYDPEGFLGVFSACTLTYIGLMVGRVFLHYKRHQDRLMMINFWAFWILLLAGILCGFSQNEGFMPVNKNLWSTSFILVTAGFGIIGLTLCYIPVDIYHVWSGAPFLYLGMNSILFYMAHQLLQDYFPFSYMIYHYNHNSLLLCHAMGVLAWVLIAYYFYKIKFFVKV